MIMLLPLTFGGSPSPNKWCTLAEPICDLATAIMHDKTWDPSSLASPSQKLVPTYARRRDRDQEKLGVGRDHLIVDIPINDKGMHDIYIDDIIALTLDVPGTNNLERSTGAHLLAIAATARPSHTKEPIPREEMKAINKLVAEATPEKTPEDETDTGMADGFRQASHLPPI